MADPEMEQLKELIRQNIALAQDTNRILKGMRNASRIKSLFWWILVLASIGVSVWSYYAFIEPRIQQIENIYQTNKAPLQGTSSNILSFLKNFNASTSTPTQ